jgi:CheY-like chemotaxis protein
MAEILFVDDSSDDAALFRFAARQAGIGATVRWAGGGEEALDLLIRRRFCPLVTVLDLKMPGIDGLLVLARLRADPLYRHVVVVVLTGSTRESDRVDALRLGCNLFFIKPDGLDGYLALARKIGELLPDPDAAAGPEMKKPSPLAPEGPPVKSAPGQGFEP